MQRMHVNIFTHRLGCSYQSLAHDLTSKEPLGGRYPVMPSSEEILVQQLEVEHTGDQDATKIPGEIAAIFAALLILWGLRG
jgi:hypothetical protein